VTDIIIASNNQGKIDEITTALNAPGIRWLTYKDFPDWPEIIETSPDFEGNARKKATLLASYFNKWALADDSGLEVDALGGEPGVLSARFAGEPANTGRNNKKLLKLLEGVPYEKRTARFRCVMALAAPDGNVRTSEASVEGRIVLKPSGTSGFGYDPLFIPNGHDLTMAELDLAEKNKISHRGLALAKLKGAIEGLAR
jgi:XTP/dITP diphosphohydrolase